MSWEEAEMRERQACLDNERFRNEIIGREATTIATSVETLVAKLTSEEGTQRAFWDDSPEGKKRYMATLLHEAAKKLGLTPDEVRDARVDSL